jgi:hypothetical protein
MNTKWTSHLKSKAEKDKFRAYLLSNTDTLKRLEELLTKEIDDTVKEMSEEDGYDCPSWAERQADRLGKIRTLRKVNDLIHIWSK